ncbi:cell wall metabolism sensor histidine kinase WalK [Paenibacillus thiaminolyticus]|uniref:histidine kinase n=1 Tax=Paenibacillus thiaminolyticus TaxID=49283 RepID=A0AAP9DVZ8_PANTH|nr:cell wall metabolism sensor histidine kinase WalK [Paenibacillus thiaminolyticus]MCY9534863.1 cell wall metabolism sensor histidine kinase WalK [Paenibacillus thiaminolyticus]MCY9604957.1 cell wall metabolism sensor histidine kinase WalK [Paenibacillus thiaminolyticus]MCY9609093.1 cell wall metabolism sensor histidine kinase WalK [Paenibacillus thiaminolyticus]MCY9616619.1 cell wall metabolism sensor histidine kinase WalK [Paenibacillus thiaminolyticus]MCY9621667.1 cell wall metabolism sens
MKWGIGRFFRTIQAKLIIIYVLLILIAMQLIGVYFVSSMKNSLTLNFSRDLRNTAGLLSLYTGQTLKGDDTVDNPNTIKEIDRFVRNFINMNGMEIQVLDATGRVLTTSSQTNMEYVGRKNTEPVVNRALQGISYNEEVIIDDKNVRKQIVAQPVYSNGKLVGALYIVASMKELYETINGINRIFFSGMAIALGLTAVLGIILAHTITQPIKEITKQATKVAEGTFDGEVPVLGTDEIGQLSEAFNYMTRRLQEALNANEEEKEKLASILTNMSDGVIATDDAGQVILVNRRACLMLGIPEADALGRSIAGLLSIPDQQVEQLVSSENNGMLLPASGDDEAAQPGSDTVLRISFTPIHRRGEGMTGSIVVLQDVTEQEKLEQSRREFVANVSHELRTPLTTIKSYAEALEDGALEEKELSERFVGVIRNETERMIRLVTDLLHLSRLDSKQAIMRKQPTDIAEMLEDVLDRFSFQFRKKRITAKASVEGTNAPVVIDRDQIDQLLDNLVSNALKYTPDGGEVTLSALFREDKPSVEVNVSDNGMGIPQKDLERIFERFYRVDKARSRNMGGTGLGLSIAREIVRAHGGDIRIESEWNEGTKVTFTLPVSAEGSDPSV